MLAFCLDPGTSATGCCFWDTEDGGLAESGKGKFSNEAILKLLQARGLCDVLVMEDITPQGFIGKTTIDTVKWLGRFQQAAAERGVETVYISRPFIKKHLTGKVNKIKDSHIRQAVIDRLEPTYTRKNPGCLRGVTADAWSAVAVGIVWSETVGRSEACK